jgi:hypothetical protein
MLTATAEYPSSTLPGFEVNTPGTVSFIRSPGSP